MKHDQAQPGTTSPTDEYYRVNVAIGEEVMECTYNEALRRFRDAVTRGERASAWMWPRGGGTVSHIAQYPGESS